MLSGMLFLFQKNFKNNCINNVGFNFLIDAIFLQAIKSNENGFYFVHTF